MKIIGISGSLRSTSSACAVLEEVKRIAGTTADLIIYDRLEKVPPFNDSDKTPEEVQYFIDLISHSDGVFFCIPEYAFGIPGALKNLLDWTVSSTAFSDKPVALITAASSGEKAHAAFLLTLKAIGTKMTDDTQLLISYIRTKLDNQGMIKDADTFTAIKKTWEALLNNIAIGKEAAGTDDTAYAKAIQ